MTVQINVNLENNPVGVSNTFHPAGPKYQYRSASSLTDLPAKLTPRQASFYRNLIRMAELLQTQELPIDFTDASGAHVAMDLGCVKIAEHAGFIQPLQNGPQGDVRSVRLSWAVVKPTVNNSI